MVTAELAGRYRGIGLGKAHQLASDLRAGTIWINGRRAV